MFIVKKVSAATVCALLVGQCMMPAMVLAQATDPNGLHLSQPPGAVAPQSYTVTNQQDPNLRANITAIPKGTTLMIRMDQPVNSESSKMGDPISATVEADVFLDNRLVVPAGSIVYGSVSSVRHTGRVGQHGQLEMRFDALRTPDGMTTPIQAHVVTTDNTGIIKGNTEQARVLQTFGIAAGGTATGTLLGTAFGSLLGATGSGALFGLGVGAIGGIGYAALRKGKQVVVPSGARLSIVVDQPVAVY